MASFIEAVGESINRAACVVLGNYVASEELLRYIVEPFSTGNDYNSSRFLYNQRCNAAPPTPPESEFSGGQCEGVQYNVSYAYDFRSGIFNAPPGTVTPASGTTTVTGRVDGVRAINTEFSATAELFGAFPTVNLGGGSSGFPNNVRVENLRITGIVRTDGQPDTCGNPPPVIPPYQSGDNTYVDNITYVNNEGDTINLPITIALGYADIDLNGSLSFPVDLDFTLNPELNVSGTLNFNTGDFAPTNNNPRATGGGCSYPSDGYGTDEEPDTPVLPSDEAPPLAPPGDEPPEREEIIAGCVVIVKQLDGKETIVFQNENPDLILPAAGYVQFLIRVGDLSGWTEPIAVKSSRAFIPCPWESGAYKVEGTPYYGAEIQVIPVYVQRTLQPQFPE